MVALYCPVYIMIAISYLLVVVCRSINDRGEFDCSAISTHFSYKRYDELTPMT